MSSINFFGGNPLNSSWWKGDSKCAHIGPRDKGIERLFLGIDKCFTDAGEIANQCKLPKKIYKKVQVQY